MAKRFHSENIYSVNDSALYVVEIYDADFVSTSTEFKVTPEGFTISPDGQTGDNLMPVVPTSFRMEMYIQNTTHRGLIIDLASAAEGRFKVRVTKDGDLHWVGNLVIDISSYEDRDYPYTFEVRATDLATLASIDYSDTGDVPYTGWETLLGHLTNCLDKTGLPAFGWSGSDIMLSIAANWYEDTMATGADKDPYALTRCNHRAFYEVQTGGKEKYLSALDVLRQVASVMGCQLRQSAGRFRLFQIEQYASDTVRWRHYDTTGAYLSNSLDTYTLDISGQDIDGARLAGGNYSWLPQVKRVRLRYRHRNWANLIEGVILTGLEHEAQELSAANGSVVMEVSVNVNRTLFNATNTVGTPYVERYALVIKVGPRYLVRNMTNFANGFPQYSAPAWSGAPGLYHFHLNNGGTLPEIGEETTFNSTLQFVTPPLLEDGDCTINVQTVGIYRTNGSFSGVSLSSFTTPSLAVSGSISVADYSNGPNAVTDTIYSSITATTSLTAIDLDLDTQIGDGTTNNSFGRLQIYNAGTASWEESSAWSVGGTGPSYQLIQKLRVQQVIAGRKSNLHIMRHTVGYAHGYEAHMRIDDGDYIWAFLGGTFSARMNDWTGTWYRVAYSLVDITSIPPYEIPSGGGIFTGPSKGGGINNPQSPNTPPYTPPPDVPGIPAPNPSDPDGLVLGSISGISTAGPLLVGPVTSIPLNQTVRAGGYQAGQTITIIDPINGVSQSFTVATDSAEGDTFISVTGYAVNNLAPGSFIVTPQSNDVLAGGTGGGSPIVDPETASEWWDIFQQWWTVDPTLEPAWPIQSDNVGFETDENAGNGSTAGFRIDGDGLTSYSASSATPGVKIGKLGKLELANLATGTGTDGLILEGGEVKVKTLTAGVTDHGELSGLADDDHTQYPLIAGRSGGQSITGGTAANNELIFNSTTSGTKGTITCNDPLRLNTVATGTGTNFLIIESNVVKQKNVTVGVTDHGALTGLADDDHTQYHNDSRGDTRYYPRTDHLNLSLGASSANFPIKLNAAGHVDPTMTNYHHSIHLIALQPGVTVTQTAGTDFLGATFLVPTELNGYTVTQVDYALTTNTSTTGSLTIGFRQFNTTNTSSSTNNFSVTFNGSDVRKTASPGSTVVSGHYYHAEVNPAVGGTLDGTVQGLLITLILKKV